MSGLKRIVNAGGRAVSARLSPPSKETNRWSAVAEGRSATGDTIEEACDNLADTLRKRAAK